MLHPIKSANSTALILGIIRELTGDTSYVAFKGIISAEINGDLKIDDEQIEVQLTNSIPNYAHIDVLWEDYGYKNYKEMGLFGRMSTQWQEVQIVKPRTFKIISETYQIVVQY